MRGFEPEEGTRVRIDIPDERDPDHETYHGLHGIIVDLIEDDAAQETGDSRDKTIYRVEFVDGTHADFRWRDLRPPIEE